REVASQVPRDDDDLVHVLHHRALGALYHRRGEPLPLGALSVETLDGSDGGDAEPAAERREQPRRDRMQVDQIVATDRESVAETRRDVRERIEGLAADGRRRG